MALPPVRFAVFSEKPMPGENEEETRLGAPSGALLAAFWARFWTHFRRALGYVCECVSQRALMYVFERVYGALLYAF